MDSGSRPEDVSPIRRSLHNQSSQEWRVFGSKVPKAEIVYFCQISIVYVIIVTSIINLSLNNGNSELWISLLCSAIGYALPAPTLQNGRTLSVPKQHSLERTISRQ